MVILQSYKSLPVPVPREFWRFLAGSTNGHKWSHKWTQMDTNGRGLIVYGIYRLTWIVWVRGNIETRPVPVIPPGREHGGFSQRTQSKWLQCIALEHWAKNDLQSFFLIIAIAWMIQLRTDNLIVWNSNFLDSQKIALCSNVLHSSFEIPLWKPLCVLSGLYILRLLFNFLPNSNENSD
jgi:hypothetical protein